MMTDAFVKSAKAKEKPYKLSDGGGLQLLVTQHGSKLWRFAYRFGGKQKVLALGAYPTVPLARARLARDEAKALLSEGRDPSEHRKTQKVQAAVQKDSTFEAVARAWFEAKRESIVDTYSARIISRLEGDIFPEIGALHVGKIEPPILLAAIRKIEARGAIELAKRVKNYCGEVFRFAIAEGKATRDPSADIRDALKKRAKTKGRVALKEVDLPDFLKALNSYQGEEQTKLLLRFTLLTFVRTQEVRFAEWAEFEELDGEQPLWRIPAERMKMRDPHLVPLAPQALEVLAGLRKLAGASKMVAPSAHKSGVISENTMIYALYRMGYHSRATVHGFRGTASTILNENGFNRDWIERQLAHVEQNNVRAAYNAAEWLPQRRNMMRWWADYLQLAG